jgi:hypothetical protein
MTIHELRLRTGIERGIVGWRAMHIGDDIHRAALELIC